ncbi:gluconeogenesis factor YvcK family protein [Protofrankia symbiont of Coriaria ruscifolia]|uniref:gluconeogenesis factor YvcK family protein n=1 Tax=Protofrankia symbiont of Coriaria ruscifolia TaxID=1306542 RepID=UPI001F5F34F8|nr:uridine diphosphate-N-acetylglucosamine-binding protein YvcK [Protofrankia symbiont of Coriaria ruscifolia]
MPVTDPAVVAFGGGHGLAASLRALRRITRHLTAVVTVGDDGGSSGRLRTELGALPMGDLRMALAALAGPDTWSSTWAELFQHRFGGDGPLAGHAVGNLVLTALAERHGSPVDALDLAGRLLGAAGRVLPLSEDGIDIVAQVAGLDLNEPEATVEVRGQAAVATTSGRVVSLYLQPAKPAACPQALAAIDSAKWIVCGPGSLYTSMLPHLLVPEITDRLLGSPARRVMVLNLVPQPGETEGYSPEEHLRVIGTHAPELAFDVVIADSDAVPEPAVLARASADLGARLYLVPVAHPGEPRHDPRRLAAAFETVFKAARESWTGQPRQEGQQGGQSQQGGEGREGKRTSPQGSGPWAGTASGDAPFGDGQPIGDELVSDEATSDGETRGGPATAGRSHEGEE